jgi:hypothetical protein
MRKNTLFLIAFIITNLVPALEAISLSGFKSIRVERGKIYHCDGKLSKKVSVTNFKCDLMKKDKHRQAPFEYTATNKTVDLRCLKGLAIFSEPQYDEGYIYKYLVTCKKPQSDD